jgi:Ca2+-binding RTX toxin-like protein
MTINAYAHSVENITGSKQEDVLDGSSATTSVSLYGIDGADILYGSNYNDVLDGGTGTDGLYGGKGNDTFYIDDINDAVTENIGEGIDTVNSSITYTLEANIENLTLIGSGVIDGSGNNLNNVITGNDAANTLYGLGGSDVIYGGNGNDVLGGGMAYLSDGVNDSLWGGEGDDILYVDEYDSFNGGNGYDIVDALYAGHGLTIDMVACAVESAIGSQLNDVLDGHLSQVSIELYGNKGNDTLYGGVADDYLDGGKDADTLSGGAGNDVLDGGAGADTLIGGRGNDTYMFSRGYSTDTIIDADGTAGNIDVLSFISGINSDQLWFRHIDNNLEVSVIGTSDIATINNWYLGSGNHIEQFKTADGKTLVDSDVENLVSAMAAFAPPASGQTSLSSDYQTTLNSVIAANWH